MRKVADLAFNRPTPIIASLVNRIVAAPADDDAVFCGGVAPEFGVLDMMRMRGFTVSIRFARLKSLI
jgi:hypothetical protein